MSTYTGGSFDTFSPFPGVEVVNADGDFSIGDFEEFAKGLIIPDHFDVTGLLTKSRSAEQMGSVIVASRTPEHPREPWAPDHHWHSDRTYWGENPFASVLYAQKLIGNVATTGLIDTSLLLKAIEDDNPGVTEELRDSVAVFSVRRYYEETLPLEGSPEAIERTVREKGVNTLAEVVVQESLKYPDKLFPATPTHPFRNELCTMIDDNRLVGLTNLSESRYRVLVEHIRDMYLRLPLEELTDRPYHYLHHWEEGQALIYPQIGTLHRAMPSPESEKHRDTLRLFIA